MSDATSRFLDGKVFAVAGASTDRSKYGNKVLRALRNAGRTTYALNPNADLVEGEPAFQNLEVLPEKPDSLSIVTQPEVTAKILEQAIKLGITSVWMQPGAEAPEAAEKARAAGLNVIDDGSCILVALSLEE